MNDEQWTLIEKHSKAIKDCPRWRRVEGSEIIGTLTQNGGRWIAIVDSAKNPGDAWIVHFEHDGQSHGQVVVHQGDLNELRDELDKAIDLCVGDDDYGFRFLHRDGIDLSFLNYLQNARHVNIRAKMIGG